MQAEVPTGKRHWSQVPPPPDYVIAPLERGFEDDAATPATTDTAAVKTVALDGSREAVAPAGDPAVAQHEVDRRADVSPASMPSPSAGTADEKSGDPMENGIPAVPSPTPKQSGEDVIQIEDPVHSDEELPPPPLPDSEVPTGACHVPAYEAPEEQIVVDVDTTAAELPQNAEDHVIIGLPPGDENNAIVENPLVVTSTPDTHGPVPNGDLKKEMDVEKIEEGHVNAAFDAEEGSTCAGLAAGPPEALSEQTNDGVTSESPSLVTTGKEVVAATGLSADTLSVPSDEEPRRPRRVSFSERPPQRAVYDAGAAGAAAAAPVDPAARAVKEQGLGPGEKWRILRNVALVSAAFMLLFTAFFGAANLQSSVNADQGLGTVSLTAVYAALIVSNLFLPSVVIRWLGCKWTVAGAMVLFAPYAAAQLSASWASLVPTALLLGAVGAPMWCAKCSYLNAAAGAYSAVTGAPRDLVMVRFFGLFYVLFPLGHVWGNLITSEVLSTGSDEAAANATLDVDVAAVCGANFCPAARSVEQNPNLARPPDQQIRTIAALFIALTVVAALLVAIGVDNLRRYGEGLSEGGGEAGAAPGGGGGAGLLVATLRLLGDRNQLLLVPITAFIGISQAFLGADFTESYIACAWGIPYIGYVLVGYGLASSLASVAVSWVVKRVGRLPVVTASICLFLVLVGVLRWWAPRPGQGAAYVVLAAAWGLADSTALVINAMYGLLFRGRESAAYSNFSLWGSAGFIATYSYSPHLCAATKLAILAAVLLLSLAGFVLAERALRRLLAAEEEAKRRQEALAGAGVSVLRDKAHAA